MKLRSSHTSQVVNNEEGPRRDKTRLTSGIIKEVTNKPLCAEGLGATLCLMAGEATREAKVLGPAQIGVGLGQDDVVVERHT
jgi:hypothetical protein